MNKKCQVFTPSDYVKKLLDSVGYNNNLYGKRIMENSCGDGNILAGVVQRYIEDCKAEGLSPTKIKNGLERDVFGVEIDQAQTKICISRLDKITKRNDIGIVDWNIACDDYLKMEDRGRYDFIVGNPPYITYSELKEEDQEYLRKRFSSCKKGKVDYCYAFLEKSLDSLSADGRMAYLIPSSVYKTVFGEAIRRKMLPYVEKVIDYTQVKLFQNALVKSSILVLNKAKNNKNIQYVDESSDVKRLLNMGELKEKWVFSHFKLGNKRFGDYFKVSHVVATLCNKVYVIKEWERDTSGKYLCKGVLVEEEMLREAKSPRLFHTGKEEKILFPYKYNKDHSLVRFEEKDFKKNYPGAYDYLSLFRTELDKRDSDDSAHWYEYGRSQALSGMDCEKALISTIISRNVSVYKLAKETIPYAGMYIVPKTNQYSIDECLKILKQDSFLQYAQNIGIHVNGCSVRITSKDIEEYRF